MQIVTQGFGYGIALICQGFGIDAFVDFTIGLGSNQVDYIF